MPTRIFHQIAAHQRTGYRPQQRGHHHKIHPVDQLGLIVSAQDNQPRHRHHHRPAHPLHHPGEHQQRQVRCRRAHQRTQHKQRHRNGKHLLRAVAVGQITAHRHKQRQRQRIGNHRRLHLQRRLLQIRRHLRQRGIQYRRIQHLHKNTNRQQQRQPSGRCNSHIRPPLT